MAARGRFSDPRAGISRRILSDGPVGACPALPSCRGGSDCAQGPYQRHHPVSPIDRIAKDRVVSGDAGESVRRGPAEGVRSPSGRTDRRTPQLATDTAVAGRSRSPRDAAGRRPWQQVAGFRGLPTPSPRAARHPSRRPAPRAVPLLIECFRFAESKSRPRGNRAISGRKQRLQTPDRRTQKGSHSVCEFLWALKKAGGPPEDQWYHPTDHQGGPPWTRRISC